MVVDGIKSRPELADLKSGNRLECEGTDNFGEATEWEYFLSLPESLVLLRGFLARTSTPKVNLNGEFRHGLGG